MEVVVVEARRHRGRRQPLAPRRDRLAHRRHRPPLRRRPHRRAVAGRGSPGLGPAAGEGDEPGLLVGIVGDLDPRPIVSRLAHGLVGRRRTLQVPVHLLGVERLVEPRGSRQVPRVDQDVAGADGVDRLLERRRPQGCVALLAGDLGIVERRLDRAVDGVPRPDRVDVDRRDRGVLDTPRTEEEGRQPRSRPPHLARPLSPGWTTPSVGTHRRPTRRQLTSAGIRRRRSGPRPSCTSSGPGTSRRRPPPRPGLPAAGGRGPPGRTGPPPAIGTPACR